MQMIAEAGFWIALAQIVWIDILLSGDNAVVIALAARALPASRQNLAIALGVVPAIALRIIFTGVVTLLMTVPYLQVAGALVLFWVAVKMVGSEEGSDDPTAAKVALWSAALSIVAADVSMSLDNIVAVAAVAKGNLPLLAIGLLMSMPLIICGSKLLMWLMERLPVLVWAGAALLGYVAGQILVGDPVMAPYVTPHTHIIVPLLGATLVVLVAKLISYAGSRRGIA